MLHRALRPLGMLAVVLLSVALTAVLSGPTTVRHQTKLFGSTLPTATLLAEDRPCRCRPASSLRRWATRR